METRALAHTYKLEPTPDQRAALVCLVGCRRFVYNWALRWCRDAYAETGTKPTYNQLAAALTQLKRRSDRLWLADVDSQALQQALRDLGRAYGNCFAGRAERPRFASKHRGNQTARIPQRVRVDEAAGTVTIPKSGAVRPHRSRPLVGVVQSATVVLDRCGDWWVSLRLEAPALADAPVPVEHALANAVGIDLGFLTYATLSTGEQIANPRHRNSRQRALKRAQRDLARKRPKSKNREQARLRVAKLHRQIARRRADTLHKLTTDLVRRYDLLCAEDLNVSGMGRTNLSGSTYDAAHGEFLRQVRYKAGWLGKHVVVVGRWYPSSKTCGACEHVYAGLTLGERVWTCAACGVTHDRDANAAANILAEGTRLFHLRLAGDERAGVPTVMAGPGRRAKPRTKRGAGPGIGPGGTTIPTPTSRRGRPRRKTPVDGASDVPQGTQRRVKQESHTL